MLNEHGPGAAVPMQQRSSAPRNESQYGRSIQRNCEAEFSSNRVAVRCPANVRRNNGFASHSMHHDPPGSGYRRQESLKFQGSSIAGIILRLERSQRPEPKHVTKRKARFEMVQFRPCGPEAGSYGEDRAADRRAAAR